jgi:hypothetical protein
MAVLKTGPGLGARPLGPSESDLGRPENRPRPPQRKTRASSASNPIRNNCKDLSPPVEQSSIPRLSHSSPHVSPSAHVHRQFLSCSTTHTPQIISDPKFPKTATTSPISRRSWNIPVPLRSARIQTHPGAPTQSLHNLPPARATPFPEMNRAEKGVVPVLAPSRHSAFLRAP